MGPFSSGSLGCTSYPRHLLAYSFSSMAGASDTGEPSYSLQLSSEMVSISTMLERLVPRLCRSGPSGLDHPLPATVSPPLSWSATPRLYDSIGGEHQLAVSIPHQSNRLVRRQLLHDNERNASLHVCRAVWTRGLQPRFCWLVVSWLLWCLILCTRHFARKQYLSASYLELNSSKSSSAST